jgi:hypothetical protein
MFPIHLTFLHFKIITITCTNCWDPQFIIHYLVCLATGPQPLPKWVLYRVQLLLLLSSFSIISFPYVHRAAVYIFFVIFPSLLPLSLRCSRRQFLCNGRWIPYPSIILVYVGCSFLVDSMYICNTSFCTQLIQSIFFILL